MKRVLCFDLGWTLEDESPAQWDRVMQIRDILVPRGISFDPEAFLEAMDEAGSQGVSSVYAHTLEGIGLDSGLRGELKRKVRWNADLCRLYPDVGSTLNVLGKDHVLKIIANQSKPVDRRLEACGIRDCFSQVICSCEVGCDKPDERIFRLALEQADSQDTEYWMIGDRLDNDIVPAKKMGWKTVRILQGSHRGCKPRGLEEEPDVVVGSLGELAELF